MSGLIKASIFGKGNSNIFKILALFIFVIIL